MREKEVEQEKNLYDEGCLPPSVVHKPFVVRWREERYFNRIFTPIIFQSRKFFSTLDILSLSLFLSPLNFLLRLVRKEKRAAKREREDKEEEEEEGRIEKVLVSEATQRD